MKALALRDFKCSYVKNAVRIMDTSFHNTSLAIGTALLSSLEIQNFKI